MILTAIIGFFGAFFLLIISLLPTMTLPEQITDALSYFVNVMYGWSWIIPANEIVTILTFAVIFHMGIFTFKVFKYILNIIRGAGA